MLYDTDICWEIISFFLAALQLQFGRICVCADGVGGDGSEYIGSATER